MKIHSVEIKNILSIENASLTFGDAGLVLVEGYDYDTGRANGAGKSTIFNAISFALYDKVPRKITKSELLRKGTREGFCFVEVDAHSGRYGVKRCRPASVQFYKDGKEVDMTQDEFEDKIGLNYEQFLTTMYTAQDSTERFLNLNDTKKKDFILKIMNLSRFTKAKSEIADEIKSLDQKRQLISTKLQGLKSNLSIYKESLVDPEAIRAKIDQNNRDIEFYISEIKKLETVTEPDLSKYSNTETKIQDKLMNLQSVKMLCAAKRNELDKLKKMTPDTQCPECNAELNIISGHVHKAADQAAIDKQINIVVTQINEYETELVREQDFRDLLNKIKLKKQEEYAEFNSATASISEYRNSINVKKAENANLDIQINKNNDIKLKMKGVIDSAKNLNTELKSTEDDIFLLNAVESVFDSTGAPAYVMDSIVDNLNEAVSNYISEIWPNATYTIHTYKQNKDKSIKAKFSETLVINGKERSIGSLSGGEARALSLALDFAIIDVLSSQYGMQLNPIILDEPFNSLDSAGREVVIDILVKFSQNRQVWTVDHATEAKAMFNQVVRVEKRNGVSKIA